VRIVSTAILQRFANLKNAEYMKRVSDLLPGAMTRANIGRQVVAAQIVDKANEWLNEILPEAHRQDACAMSIQNGILTIASLSSSVSNFICDRESGCLNLIKRSFPNAQIDKLRTRLVAELQ
jgi:hypothetical protein